VIDRDVLLYPVGLECSLVFILVRTADRPIGVWGPEGIRETAEILAGRLPPEVEDRLRAKVLYASSYVSYENRLRIRLEYLVL
jgi:hypothetical protein